MTFDQVLAQVREWLGDEVAAGERSLDVKLGVVTVSMTPRGL